MKAKSHFCQRTRAVAVPAIDPKTSRLLSRLALLGLLLLARGAAAAPSLVFETKGGDAWTFEKRVIAHGGMKACDHVIFSSPAGSAVAEMMGNEAWSNVPLRSGENLVTAECMKDGKPRGTRAEQYWNVRLADHPKAWARTVPGEQGGMSLDAGASELAPAKPAPIVSFEWRARPGNPAILAGLPAHESRIEIETPHVDGEYYVILRVIDAAGSSDETTVVFRARQGKAETVDLADEHPDWVDNAVVYGVAPFFFGRRGFDDVTARLDYLHSLGINTLWLSPITATTEGDFGYAVTDYFRLRPDFGSAADLHELVTAAHARKMRVIMDFVANHVSVHNGYFIDAERRKRASAYYSFFTRDASGNATHYFDWKHLINLNFDNPEVQRWMIEAFSYWLREFDIDGFRVDAVWGPRQRAPEFWARWRQELKRIKPDVMLLAEASARDPYYFRNGFDAAYDWTETLGVWAWRDAFDDPEHTASKLRDAILASQAAEAPHTLVFRFLNNNDTGIRFIKRYGLARARLASAMLLSLPGIPQVYTGEEVGAEFLPYDEGPPISWADPHGLRDWYALLIALRARHAGLRSKLIEFLDVGESHQLLAYLRRDRGAMDNVLVLINWGMTSEAASLPAQFQQHAGLVDLASGERLASGRVVNVPPVSVRILARSSEFNRVQH
jgi:cyclomaltodextrinase